MNIYIRNLTNEITADELRAAFAKFGRVDEVIIRTGPVPGEPRSLAMVVMPVVP